MTDVAQKVVIDCSLTGAPPAEYAQELNEAALKALSNGNMDKAQALLAQAKEIEERAALPAVQVLDLDKDELKQREKDQAEFKKMATASARVERNALLSSCDWTQVSDTPLSAAKQKEWQTYRRKLRDLDFSEPDKIKWPVAPDG